MNEKLKFTILCFASILLSFAVITAFVEPGSVDYVQNKKEFETKNGEDLEMILQANKLLHEKWIMVEQYNKNYFLAKISGAKASELDSANALKLKEHTGFLHLTDSLEAHFKNNKNLTSIITSFKQELKNTDFPEEFLINNNIDKDSSSQQQQLLKMQSNLQDKENVIEKLKNQLKFSAHPDNKEEYIKKTDGEIKFLKWALSSEVNSNYILTSANKTLKQTNTNLSAEINELKKTAGGQKN